MEGNLSLSVSISVLPGLKIILSDEHLALMSDKKTSKLGEEYIMLFIKTEMRKSFKDGTFLLSTNISISFTLIDSTANKT